MKNTIIRRLPKLAKKWILNGIKKIHSVYMDHLLFGVPQIHLEEKHVANCKLVLNREAMLKRLGQQNIAAELGVNRGEFSAKILRISRPKILHLIDIWDSERYNNNLFLEVKEKFTDKLQSGTVQIHRKLSTEASSDFEDGYFDFVYIDTEHSYNVTKEELTSYASKMKRNGIIAGHDYTRCTFKAGRFGVIDAVHEFCVKYNWELIYVTAEPLEMQSFAIKKIEVG